MLRSPSLIHFKNSLKRWALFVAVLSVGVSTFVQSANAAGIVLYQNPTVSATQGFHGTGGSGGGVDNVAWVYKSASSIDVCSIAVPVRKVGSPTDYVYITVGANNATSTATWNPDAVSYTSDAVLGSSLPSSGTTFTEFTFGEGTCLELVGGELYNFVLNRTTASTMQYEIFYSSGIPDSTYLRSYNFNPSATLMGSNVYNIILYGFNNYNTTTYFTSTTVSFASITSAYVPDTCDSGSSLFSSSTIADIGCEIRVAFQRTLQWLFIPTSTAPGITQLNTAIASFQGVFPFNVFFNFNSAVHTLSDAYTTSTQSISVTLPSPMNFTVSINSSTVDDVVGSSTWSFVRTAERNLIWLVLGIAILLFIV